MLMQIEQALLTYEGVAETKHVDANDNETEHVDADNGVLTVNGGAGYDSHEKTASCGTMRWVRRTYTFYVNAESRS